MDIEKVKTFIIRGSLPTLNELIKADRTSHFVGNKLKQGWQNRIVMCLKKTMKDVHFENPVNLQFVFYEPTRKRDPDNVSAFARKVILDAMVKCEIIPNDTFKYIRSIHDIFLVDTYNPRIVVTIEEISNG